MDSSFVPPALLDLLAGLPRPSGRGKTRRQGAKKEAVGSLADSFQTLVADDRLFFRFVFPAPADGFPPPAEGPGSLAAIAEAFRRAFSSVWERIPVSGRRSLVHYWRSQGPASLVGAYHRYPLRYPLIRIVDVIEPGEDHHLVMHSGHVLNFPTARITERPEQLADLIVKVLLWVSRLASRDHWASYLELVEEPMDRWERRRGARATEEEQAAKLATLERAFLRRHHAAATETLRRWGFDERLAHENIED